VWQFSLIFLVAFEQQNQFNYMYLHCKFQQSKLSDAQPPFYAVDYLILGEHVVFGLFARRTCRNDVLGSSVLM